MDDPRQHAVVVGAGISGLLAARVLADSYGSVTLIERDELPSVGEHRKGVPQSRHVHGLLARGRELLESFFPGVVDELVAQGAHLVDSLASARRYIGDGYYCREPSDLQSLLVSRPLLEASLRQRVLERSNVRLRSKTVVGGLVANADASAVCGVRVGPAVHSTPEVLPADLVVDAAGRGSRVTAWLEALGYAAPAEEIVKSGAVYVSRMYRRHSAQLDGTTIVQVIPSRGARRGGFAIALEKDQWIVTLAGYGAEAPASDERAIVELAQSLPAKEIYEVVRSSEALTPPTFAKLPASQRRHFEDLRRFPRGLLVVGDSLCSFNPIYGQGMTVAALEAKVLSDLLAARSGPSPRRFFREVARVLDRPWSITVENDKRLASLEALTWKERALHWYMERVHRAAQVDVAIALAFLRVTNMVASSASLLRPRVLARVLFGGLWRRKAADATTGA